jgi:endonuclease/exonuclease/phosphatase family metal-dependent hydrolase
MIQQQIKNRPDLTLMKRLLILLLFCSTVIQAQVRNVADERFARDSGEFRFMTYNIRVGKGMDKVNNLHRIADVINREKPDVASLQEVDSVTLRTGSVDQIRELGSMTGMHAVFASALDFDGGKYGVGILSREEPLSVKRIPLSGREEPRVLLIVEFSDYVAVSTHFSLTEEDRIASAEILSREAILIDKPVLVGGDFNAEPQSEPVRALCKIFTMLSDDTLPTFPADKPEICIDYVFAKKSDKLDFKVLSRTVIPENIASDHRPVLVVLKK